MADNIPFPSVRNRKLAEKLKGAIKQGYIESNEGLYTKTILVCSIHGQAQPMNLRNNGEYHCSHCVADMIEKVGGKMTMKTVPI
jgi:hypothetical protein